MGLIRKLFSYQYITQEHLTGLDKYKYSCVDSSPLSKYVMHPFWNFIVEFYPRWLAPNVLTFVGFLCLIVNFILFSIYDYSFYGYCSNQEDCTNPLNLTQNQLFYQANLNKFESIPSYICSCIPQWLWLVLSICQFLSHHLDGTDGKQARRTGSSSPLGELFDHGLDSWAALFLPVALFSLFGRNEPFGISAMSMYGLLWLILGSFIVSHWEKYNTGILFLPWSYDLSQVGMTFLFFGTFLFGQKIWYFNIGPILFTQFVVVIIYVASIGLSLPFSLYNMYMAYVNKSFKQKSIYEGVRPIFSTVYLFIIQLIWIKYSKINILDLEPRAFFWLTGTLFSNIACRLIVAQMTSTRCQIFNWTLIPLTFIVGLFTVNLESTSIQKYLTAQAEVNALYFMVVLITLAHIHYGICMVQQICQHLKIYCFVITSRPNSYKKNDQKEN
ncbi:unnamed protein product [Brachionus calyciflorus]|uniref:Selenoprotein I n=1 Tax=Brachionus calyciflorus TaxID=104777 RepID=A0A813NMU8_9BILA|nr:unnamed protein product [Brachionus calyciflorus]